MNTEKQQDEGGSTVTRIDRPSAWQVIAFGVVQKLTVRADVAGDIACAWRGSDPNADAFPLYDQSALDAAVAAAQERCANAARAAIDADLQTADGYSLADAVVEAIRGAEGSAKR